MDYISSDYTFNNMGRIGYDNCSMTQVDIQNTKACNLMTQNYNANNCNLQSQINLATYQPCVNYTGGHGASGGCNIDDSSNLLIGTIQTHPKCKIDLFHRPFATVPFLGRGAVNPDVESQVRQGDSDINKRSANGMGEKSHFKYSQTPLMPAYYEMYNGRNGIESNNRCGIPSRELTRDNKQYKQ